MTRWNHGCLRRARIYQLFLDWKRAHDGAPPSYRQIAEQFDPPLSLSMVYYHVRRLIEQGLLEWRDGALCSNGEWMNR